MLRINWFTKRLSQWVYTECEPRSSARSLRTAIKHLAAQVVAAHNHPSGDPKPSEDDMELTKRLTEAGKMMGIEVMDHVIVSKNSHYSFKEEKLL